MVNPGVIKLIDADDANEICNGINKRFEIEDNLGEAIHIHYDNIRFDLSINEFNMLSDSVDSIIDRIVRVPGFRAKDYDKGFLAANVSMLMKIAKVNCVEKKLEELFVDTFDEKGNAVLKNIMYSRVYKSLCGDMEEDSLRKQKNYFYTVGKKMTNYQRTMFCLEKIKEKGYPFDGEYIVVDSRSGKIIDGQHRAACLYYLKGNISVPVREVEFVEDKKCNVIGTKEDREELISFLESKRNIYIYGAGMWARRVLFLMEYLNREVKAFIVSGEPDCNIYCGKKVYSVNELSKKLSSSDGIIAGFEASKNYDLKSFLKGKNITAQLCEIRFNKIKKMYEDII